jgi:hypothetical protein
MIGDREPARPPIVPRPDWGADESLRFDRSGREITPPTFWPVQKLVVHHTAGQHDPPDPAATIRAIQRFHVVDRGFGDVAYNLLIDSQGSLYEGRFSPDAAAGEAPAGHDTDGRVVAATHTLGYNAGTLSIALLGNFVEREPSAAAIEKLIVTVGWLAFIHRLDPLGEGVYRNPLSGEATRCSNVAGHRELGSTLCPGARLAARLVEIRLRALEVIDSADAGIPPA